MCDRLRGRVQIRMLSRSAMVRLKAILLIDVIVVGAAAGAFFFFSSEGLITGGSSPLNLR